MASFPDLFPGLTLAVFYDDDVLWHERLVLWRLTDLEWYVLTPDLDMYAEDLSCSGGDGPSKFKVKGKDFRYWSRVGGGSYRFAKPINDDQLLRTYIKQAFREGSKEASFDPDWRPDHVVDTKGVVQDTDVFLGPLVLHRLTDKGPANRRAMGAGVVAGGDTSGDDDRVTRPIVEADPSQVWLITENIDQYKIGDYARVDPSRDLMLGGHTGLIRVASGWAKAELILTTDAAEFVRARRGDAGSPSPSPLQATEIHENEEGSSDARTLMVDYDHQGARFKEWRVVVADSKDYHYEDWPCEGPSTVLHLLKHDEVWW